MAPAVQRHAQQYVTHALGEPLMTVAHTLDFLADKDSRNRALVSQISDVKAQLGGAARDLPRELTNQLNDITSSGRVDMTPMYGALMNTSRILDKYRAGSGRALFPEVADAKEALTEIWARTQPGPIIAGIVQPAAKEIGQ